MKVRVVCHVDRIIEVEEGENPFEKAFALTPPENYFWQPYENQFKNAIEAERTQRDEIDFPCLGG